MTTDLILRVAVWSVLGAFAALSAAGIALALVAWIRTARRGRARRVAEEARLRSRRWVPPLSLAILPSRDDQEVIETVTAAVGLNFPALEVIVVCDGTHGTLLPALVQRFDLRRSFRVYRHEAHCARLRAVYVSALSPGLILVDKPEDGSADALNAAINVAGNPLFAWIVSGTSLDPGPLYRMLEEYVQAPPAMAAVVAPTRIEVPGVGGLMNEVARFELALPEGHGWTSLAATASGAGAFAVYRKRSLELIGGFRARVRTPGVEMCFRLVDELRRWGTRGEIRYTATPVAWLGHGATRRRIRSHQAGLIFTLARHGWRMLRHGTWSARAAVAYLTVFEVLAPIAELACYVALPLLCLYGIIEAPLLLTAALVLFGGPLLRAGVAALSECTSRELFPDTDEVARRFFAVLVSAFGFHQIATWCRAFALLDALTAPRQRRRAAWHALAAVAPTTHLAADAAIPVPPPLGAPVEPPGPHAPEHAPAPEAHIGTRRTTRQRPAPAMLTSAPQPLTWAVRTMSRPSAVPLPPPASARPSQPPLPAPAPPEAKPEPKPEPAVEKPAKVKPDPLPVPAIPGDPIAKIAPVAHATGREGPITFDVVTHYQIRADVPSGAMPAVQIPSGGAGPIILTTAQGSVAVPTTPNAPAPAPPGLTQAPPPPPAPAAPRGGHRARTMRKPKAPTPAPPSPEKRRTLPPIPDVPSPSAPEPVAPLPEQRAPAPAPLPPPPRPAPAEQETKIQDRVETDWLENIPDIGSEPLDLSDPDRKSTSRTRDEETDVDMPAVEGPMPVSSEPIDLSEMALEQEAEVAEEGSGDTSAVLPAVDAVISDPLDLGALEEGRENAEPTLMPDTDDDESGSDTSAVLPAVPGEIASEPLDLDAFEEAVAPAAPRGLTFEPIEPSEINRSMTALGQSPIFYGVQASDRNRLVPFLRTAKAPAGLEVLREGEQGRGLFLVMAGKCDIVQHDEHGAEKRLATLGPGDCFGEMSLLTGDPASATVRCAVDAQLLIITQDDFPKLTEALPWLGITLARLIAQRLARTSASVVDELKKGLFGRLELIPPSALVQAVNVNAQSGLLVVQSGKQSFTAYFQDGQLWEAETEDLDGEEAFYEFLSWSSGSFRFEPQRRQTPRLVASDTVGLLLEGLRRIDETRRMTGGPSVKLPSLTKQTARRDAVKRMEAFSLRDEESAARALGRLSLFSGLRAEQVKQVIGVMQEVHALLGDVIIRQGQEGQALYVVSSGAFDVVKKGAEGREEKLATLGPGDCFGEISLITGEAATATVSVREEGSLLVIPREDLFQLLGRIPALGASLARILASRLAKASRWLKEQQEIITGRLESMPPTELVQALNVNRQSGTLAIQHESKSLEAEFVEGEVQDVRLDDLRGDEAFFIMITWTSGAFRFTPGVPEEVKRTVRNDTMGLLFRGLRRLERARLKREEIETRSRMAVPMKERPSEKPEEAPRPKPAPAAVDALDAIVDLDLRDLSAIRESTREVGVVPLEPLEPGDIRRGLEALAQSPVFYGVQAADRNRILPYLRTAYVEPQQDVLMEGKPGRGLFVVMSGAFDVLQKAEGDSVRTLATLGPGECFGEMSMLTGEAASATVRSTKEGRLLAIAREDFAPLVKALPWLGLTLARLLAERLMRTSGEVVKELNKGMVGRLELVNAPALVQAINVNVQSGVLTVDGPKASFRGYFHEGQLYEASCGDKAGPDALYEMVTWAAGTFKFEPERMASPQRRIAMDTVGLLLEAMRRVDESKKISGPQAALSTTQRRKQERVAAALPSLEDERAATEALHRLSLFSGVRKEDMAEVLSVIIERRSTAGDVIVRQGQLAQALYLVAAGEFEVVQRDSAGVQNKLATVAPGECFGDLALVTGAPAEATVSAKGDGHLFVIPREEFVQLLGRVPELGASLARILASRLARASRWIQDQVESGIFGRLESMPATELVQALHVNQQSGTLAVQSENKTVEVVFLDGEIQDARADDLRGDEAFFRMLLWSAGAFRFEPGRPQCERTVKSDTVGLLFRGMRRIERARQKVSDDAARGLPQGSNDPESRGRLMKRPKDTPPPA